MTRQIGNDVEYRASVKGCWLGKAIGGTLGGPFEGEAGPLDVAFYTPVPTQSLPNDDLDLQVVWAFVIDKLDRPRVDREVLVDAWLDHVGYYPDEYGVAIRNLQSGLRPPLTGSYDNWFVHGMGGAIRTEIWACLSPGDPRLAASYAYEDACVDHDGEGIWAAVFLASLESLAFAESDRERLLDESLKLLPEASAVRRAIQDTRVWWEKRRDWRAVRELILRRYGHENFTDVTANLAFIVLGWLAGDRDFGRAICIATNCGRDTDCTAATLGALLGILHPSEIPPEWVAPIGEELVLSPSIRGVEPRPGMLDEFTNLVVDLRRRIGGCYPPAPTEHRQSTDHLAITVYSAFTDGDLLEQKVPPAPEMTRPVPMRLPGTLARLPREAFRGDALLLRYRFALPRPLRARVMFNTRQRCRVWVDGRFAFGREGGRMAPSPHRVPRDQSIDLDLAAGGHELLAAIARPDDLMAEWVVGVADGGLHCWLPNVFQ